MFQELTPLNCINAEGARLSPRLVNLQGKQWRWDRANPHARQVLGWENVREISHREEAE